MEREEYKDVTVIIKNDEIRTKQEFGDYDLPPLCDHPAVHKYYEETKKSFHGFPESIRVRIEFEYEPKK